MAKTCTVEFRPDGISAEVPQGATILSAAAKAGVLIDSLCGGEGVCGRCRVIVREGTVSGSSNEFFSFQEVQQGYVLACQGRAESDLVVEVPPQTRLAGAPPQHVPGEVPFPSEPAGHGIALLPLVRKSYLTLTPPSLQDNLSDLQRLEEATCKAIGCKELRSEIKVIRPLPNVLRQNDWKVTAVTSYRGKPTEIIDVQAGDTSHRNFCIAADIGTTTVVCYLVDLRTGQTLGRAAKYNSQAAHGADVIRRIIYASQSADRQRALQKAIIGDLNELIRELTARYRLEAADIPLITAAGNTTMTHLLLGLPTENIRKEPYVGAAYQLPPFRAAEVGLRISPSGRLYCLPAVAGFVGGDIVAGVYATGLAHSDKVRMLIDIGTNGEIVIGNRDFLVCASASAGPAFEGAECQSGMRATRGAIDHIRLTDAKGILNYSTIGSAPPVGLCGTGYVDLVAEMLRVGLIDRTGRLNPQAASERFRLSRHDEPEWVVVPASPPDTPADVLISQGDINNLLRAKGAIYAAATVLLHALNMSFQDLAEIAVAGAFGNFLNLANAVFIGLLPDIPHERLRFVGNTSIAGARLAALSTEAYEEMSRIAERMTYFELSTDPTFMDQFVSACFFPHTNIELFPHVSAEMAGGR